VNISGLKMNFAGKDFVRITHYSKKEIEYILDVAEEFEDTYRKKTQMKLAEGKILATLFFQPSTRTQFSFQTSMHRLGGSVLGFAGTEYTSVMKGENLEDTIRMFDSYTNIIVIRHPEAGSAEKAAEVAKVPVINGGDGSNRHPTQALLDLYSIRKFKGKIKDIKFAFWGGIKYSRVAHSLALGLAMFGAKIYQVYPGNQSLPDNIIQELKEKYNVSAPPRLQPDEALKQVDIVYMGGAIQDLTIGGGKAMVSEEERKKTLEEYNKYFVLSLERFKKLGVKDDLLVMHPLPRHVETLKPDLDNTKHCGYFEEAGYGIPVRMALLALLLNVKN